MLKRTSIVFVVILFLAMNTTSCFAVEVAGTVVGATAAVTTVKFILSSAFGPFILYPAANMTVTTAKKMFNDIVWAPSTLSTVR